MFRRAASKFTPASNRANSASSRIANDFSRWDGKRTPAGAVGGATSCLTLLAGLLRALSRSDDDGLRACRGGAWGEPADGKLNRGQEGKE